MARKEDAEDLQRTILLLEEELKRLTEPPYRAGTVLELGRKTVRVVTDCGDLLEVAMPTEKGASERLGRRLKQGSRIVLNMAGAIVEYSEFDRAVGGEITTVDEIEGGRLRVQLKGEPRMVLTNLKGVKVGDEVQLDRSGLLAVERFERKKTRYALEKVPQAPWEHIGGLEAAIHQVRSEIERPFLHRDIFNRYGRKPVKGILIYGPPGCGKTMIAKAIAYNLARLTGKSVGHFIGVKGPEILNKYVGNSEANIRRIYAAARDAAGESGIPTIVFIDEAEAIMKMRGTGISTDVFDSIVPQFLAEMDGLDGGYGVITVLATNREDIIDPAVLRDGRIDRKIKIPRPDRKGAEEIFRIYLRGKPLQDPLRSVEDLAKEITERIYQDGRAACNVVSPRGVLGSFRYQNMMSGAMIKGIVDRACGFAIDKEIEGKNTGLSLQDLYHAAEDGFGEIQGFAQAFVMDDWEAVFGAKGRHYYEACRQKYLCLERAGDGNTEKNEWRQE